VSKYIITAIIALVAAKAKSQAIGNLPKTRSEMKDQRVSSCRQFKERSW